jgi:hypothetical protein
VTSVRARALETIRVEVEHALEPLVAFGLECLAEPGRDPALRRQRIEEIGTWRRDPAFGDETVEGITARSIDRRQHGDGSTMLGHLEALASLDPSKVAAEVLPQLSHTDPSLIHVAHGSTF